jgi:hypothetical protein
MIQIGNPHHGRMIALKAGVDFDVERNPVISRTDEHGDLLGGVIYSDYTGVSMRIHMAGSRVGWASPLMLWMAFDYPFNQLGVELLLGSVRSTDKHVLNIDRRLGFKEIFRIPKAVPGGDLVLLSMSRADCKWLKVRPRAAMEKAA